MKKDKKEVLSKNIEKLQQQLEEMKNNNPDEDFTKIEEMIDHLISMIDSTNKKGYFWKYLFKNILFLISIFILYVLCVGAILGFSYSYLNLENPLNLLYLTPVIAVVLLILQQILNLVINRFSTENSLKNTFFANITFVLLITLVDYAFIHFYNNFWICLVSLIGIFILGSTGEFYISKKFLFW